MNYFHIRIRPKSNRSEDEIEFDLDEETLMARFVTRYREGRDMAIAGRPVPIDDIEQIKIGFSEDKSEALRGAAREEWRRIGAASVEWYMFKVAEDVTARYITGPPGEDAVQAPIEKQELKHAADTRKVFVVSGRDTTNHDAMFDFLRSLELSPIEFSQARGMTRRPSPYIGEILDEAFSAAQAIVVLLTPDDEARLKEPFHRENDPPHETEPAGQARPNVLFEAGMAMGRDPDRTVLVEIGRLRPFSDIAGLHIVRFDGSSQMRQDLAHRLRDAGCDVDLDGQHWHTAGDFVVP